MIKPYEDAMTMMMWREKVPETGAYDTVNSIPSIMDDLYAHVL